MEVGGRPMIERVIASVQSSASWVNKGKGDIRVTPCLLVPFGDRLGKIYAHRITTFEGPEDDVLTRYFNAAEKLDVSHMCRITADCPRIPAVLISDCILKAVNHNYDYNSNTETRWMPDGWDCEVISRKLLEYTHMNAKDPEDREHVTTYTKREKAEWARYNRVVPYEDFSNLKVSVDTTDDLEYVRAAEKKTRETLHGILRAGETYTRF
ncbi:MAG: hypothetical protein ACXADY_26595 [Candidatus Hodarchaeales archaeon]|jgi:spore coat polysaccharide biosynthesis protein SpsF (cytidylyltransferase family)